MISAMARVALAVDDFANAVALFGDVFAMPVTDLSGETVPSLGSHVGMAQPPGGSNIELMAPANPDLPLSQTLQKFLDRRGEGFYALMLEAADPDAEAEELRSRGMEVLPLMAGAGGRDIHPRSTHGVLIRVYPDNSVRQPDYSDRSPGGTEDGAALSGITRVIVATGDATLAAKAYGEGLGLAVDDVVEDEARGVLVARVHPPKGGVIELVSALDGDQAFARDIAGFVAEKGEGIYALVLRADRPEAALARLAAGGLAVVDNQVSVYGARLLIE